jgi:hypothetical protein
MRCAPVSIGAGLSFDAALRAAFFYSGILTREALRPPGRVRRILTLLAAVPIAGAVLDAVENALAFAMMLSGHRPAGAHRLHHFQRQMDGALCGMALLLGALLGRQQSGNSGG